MNLFKIAREKGLKSDIKECYYCSKSFKPDKRNLNRGWGIFCSKKCSALYKIKFNLLNDGEKLSEVRNRNLKKLGIE
jgi:hypothetical protein